MNDTRSHLLSEAEFLIRTRGYAAFSYADLAERVRISKASIHHHFPTKEILGATLIDEYLARFEKELQRISTGKEGVGARLAAYEKLFSNSLKGGMLPLCGALSAEISALPSSLRKRVRKFFEIHLDWLKLVLQRGVHDGELCAELNIDRAALLVLGSLEGASFVSWALGDSKIVANSFSQILDYIHPLDSKIRSQLKS
jgi:TetR/AcrR family transcriptional regulator, transcriptional repressor for nem operon